MEVQLTFMVDTVVEVADREEAEAVARLMESECELGGRVVGVDHRGTVIRRPGLAPINHQETRDAAPAGDGIARLETTGRNLVADIGKAWGHGFPAPDDGHAADCDGAGCGASCGCLCHAYE